MADSKKPGRPVPDAGLPRSQQQPTSEELARKEALKAYLRAENEDDDGYDPYSDRPATVEPLFERDPWA